MTPKPIHAFDILTDGSVQRLEDIAAPEPAHLAYRWIHLDLAEPGVRDWIAQRTDPVVAQALTRQDTRPSVNPLDDGHILILRGVNLNPESDPEDMVSIRIWLAPNLIISTRVRRLMAVVGIREQVEAGHPPASAGAFIAKLAAGLTERMDPVVAELADRIDALEEESVDRAAGLRGQLADIRRATIALRRYIAPQRDALAKLSADTSGRFERPVQIHLRETADQVTRLVEDLDAVRERSAILNDQLVDRRAEEMNANMLVLSVVAAIFLPLGFLTGLLGINVGGMPGADYAWAFYIVCALCFLIAIGLTWWFRFKHWF
ncbi:zinc transporter ZntB [Hyphobacterium sp.]|jgi:zinc transporter|uniref:zinc transporter ZntB n=1 Tax=Hyphobacterium sp. TaxID=2004662 RepID=UPI003BAB1E92